MPSSAEYDMITASFDATESVEWPPGKSTPNHKWVITVDWTAGSGGSLAIKTRPKRAVTAQDTTVHTVSQATDGDTSVTVEDLCESLVFTHTQGTASEVTVRGIACAIFNAARGGADFRTLTPA